MRHAELRRPRPASVGRPLPRVPRRHLLYWLVLMGLATWWSVRPRPIAPEQLYGRTGDTVPTRSAVAASDSFAERAVVVAPDSAAPIVDWRLLGTLNVRSTSIPPQLARFNGQRVRIPGFIVPLEDFQEKAKEFLLVPYFGACVHTPPPPPNQMVLVKLSGGPTRLALFDPVWIEGVLEVQKVMSPYGAVSYRMRGRKIVPYRDEP
jgi:hypothetical protein